MPLLIIADDSMFQRYNNAKIAVSEGFEVMEAGNGRECLELIESQQPQGLLLDLNMPIIRGIEVLERLKEAGSAIKVAVITADIQETTKQRVMELGVTDIFYKPVGEDDLREFLRGIKG